MSTEEDPNISINFYGVKGMQMSLTKTRSQWVALGVFDAPVIQLNNKFYAFDKFDGTSVYWREVKCVNLTNAT